MHAWTSHVLLLVILSAWRSRVIMAIGSPSVRVSDSGIGIGAVVFICHFQVKLAYILLYLEFLYIDIGKEIFVAHIGVFSIKVKFMD